MLMFDLSLHMEAVTVLAVTKGEETGIRNAFVSSYKFLPFLCQ